MHGVFRRTLAAAALAGVAAAASAAELPGRVLALEDAEAAAAIDRKRLSSVVTRPLGDAQAARARVADVLAASGLSPHGQEALLSEALIAVRAVAPDPALRMEVERLAARGPQAWVWLHEPGHALQAVPYAYAGANARLTLRIWNRQAIVQRADAQGLAAALALPAAAEDRDAALADAVQALPAAALAPAGALLAAELERGAPVERALAAAAERARDPALFATLFATGAPGRSVHLLPRLATLAPADALAVLETIDASALADAASHQLALLAAREPRAREALLARLADPARGAGAAAALASLHDAALAGAIERRVVADDLASRRALLALRLDASPAARAALARLHADRRLPAALRREIAPWLAR